MFNLSYCPNKKFAEAFLENLDRGIDRAVYQNVRVFFLVDNYVNYWDPTNFSTADTIVFPFQLNINNVSHATRGWNNKGIWIVNNSTERPLTINKAYLRFWYFVRNLFRKLNKNLDWNFFSLKRRYKNTIQFFENIIPRAEIFNAPMKKLCT